VARHVQGHALAIECVEIKVCDDNVLLLTQRFDHVFPIWANKDGAVVINIRKEEESNESKSGASVY